MDIRAVCRCRRAFRPGVSIARPRRYFSLRPRYLQKSEDEVSEETRNHYLKRWLVVRQTGSVARDHLANERTFLAWLRTGLGFVALGIAVERFSQLELGMAAVGFGPKLTAEELKIRNDKEQILVGGLLGAGTGSVFYGIVRYFSNYQLLKMGLFRPAVLGAGALGFIVAGLAGSAYYSAFKDQSRKREKEKEA